jgi:signal transduction histidine kinase
MKPARGEPHPSKTGGSREVIRLEEFPSSRQWPSRNQSGSTRRVADLERERDALERERDALKDFGARAAHELVAPLLAIEAYSTAVATRLVTHDAALRDVERIGRVAARSRRLVETMLYSTQNDHLIEPRPVDLNALVVECLSSVAADLEDRETPLEVGDLPTVSGDPGLLLSLFTNMVVNGLRYGPRRGGHIVIAAAEEPTGDWRITVDSAGVTMPPEDRERIFSPFERGSHERRSRGAGLGLAICRDIVERHGGRIGAVPIPGGNRFWFTLPPV